MISRSLQTGDITYPVSAMCEGGFLFQALLRRDASRHDVAWQPNDGARLSDCMLSSQREIRTSQISWSNRREQALLISVRRLYRENATS